MDYESIKLYHFPATRSARVRWALHETVGDDFELEVVALYDGAQFDEAYLSKNPNHSVPVLEVVLPDGERLRLLESVAMVEWLAEAFPDKGLAPPPVASPARADYLQMLHFAGTWMDMMLWQVRIHEHVLPLDQCDERTVSRYRQKMAVEVMPQLAARLERSGYICGDDFSAADIVVGHNVFWARAYGMLQEPVFGEYMARLSGRPAFTRAFDDLAHFRPEVPGREVRSEERPRPVLV